MLACEHTVAHDGILIHPDQPTGLPHPAAFGDVGQDRDDLRFGQARSEQRRAFAFAKPGLARGTIQHAALLVGPVAIADRKVAGPPLAVVGTLLVLATKTRQVVHGLPSLTGASVQERQPSFYKITALSCNTGKTPGKSAFFRKH